MHRATTSNASHDDLRTTSSGFDQQPTHGNERAKSADPPRIDDRSRPGTSTAAKRSSTLYLDQLCKTQKEGEKHELNALNNRFGNYLEKIKYLANVNANLRRQVDEAYRKYIGHTDAESAKTSQHPSEAQLNQLRQQINAEVRAQTLIQVRLQRANYDIKFYQDNLKLLAAHDKKQSDQTRLMRHHLEGNIHELEQLRRQYESREQDLQAYKSQYNDYMNKLIEFNNQYDSITYERMENENKLYTIKEQIAFEHEYHQRRQQEFEYLETFHYEMNKEFNANELENIVKQIRQDYEQFNAARLAELEVLYKTKLDSIRYEFEKRSEPAVVESSKPREVRLVIDTTKKEHQTLLEQNQFLSDKLEELEHDLHSIIEQNRQRHESSEREYNQLQTEIPELDCIIVHLRENAISLWSEINTYRYLLVNLISPTDGSPPEPERVPLPRPKPPVVEQHVPRPSKEPPMSKSSQLKVIKSNLINSSKGKSSVKQYRDETTGFIVHIEDGIIWVRI